MMCGGFQAQATCANNKYIKRNVSLCDAANDVSLRPYFYDTRASVEPTTTSTHTHHSHTPTSTTKNVSNTNAMSHKNRVELLFISLLLLLLLLARCQRKNPKVMIFNARVPPFWRRFVKTAMFMFIISSISSIRDKCSTYVRASMIDCNKRL